MSTMTQTEILSPTARFDGVRKRPWDLFWLVLLVVPPFLIFPRFDSGILWQDEAETATLAKRIVQYGYPLADDGRPPLDANHRSLHAVTDQRGFVDINKDGIWIWTSWFGNYLCAASFLLGKALGYPPNTFFARLPFALIGWLLFFVMYAGLQDITRNRALSRLAVFVLMFSVPYLLFTRQCRVYTGLAFFTFMQVWGYIRMARSQNLSLSMFILGGIGGFYSFFPLMVGTTTGLGLHALLKHRRWGLLLSFVLGCAAIVAATLPFFIYTRSWDRNYDQSGFPLDSWQRYAASLRAYLIHVHLYAWPFVLAIPAVLFSGVRWWGRQWLPAVATLLIVVAVIAVLASPALIVSFISLLVLTLGSLAVYLLAVFLSSLGRDSRQTARTSSDAAQAIVLSTALALLVVAGLANHPFFRYLVGVLPFLALASASCLYHVAKYLKFRIAPGAAASDQPSRSGRLRRGRLTQIGCMAVDAVLIGPFICTELFHYGPLYLARRAILDPIYNAKVNEFTAAGSPRPHEEAHLWCNKLGHLGANGYSWSMLVKEGRWTVSHPRHELEFPLFEYFGELTHDYQGPIESVIQYLNRNAQPGDVVATAYEHFPLMFYTDLIILRTREIGRRYRYQPEWVVAQHENYPSELPASTFRAITTGEYDRIELEDRPYALQWDNIPEPAWHLFRTAEDRRHPLLLFRLRDEYRQHLHDKRAAALSTLPG